MKSRKKFKKDKRTLNTFETLVKKHKGIIPKQALKSIDVNLKVKMI